MNADTGRLVKVDSDAFRARPRAATRHRIDRPLLPFPALVEPDAGDTACAVVR